MNQAGLHACHVCPLTVLCVGGRGELGKGKTVSKAFRLERFSTSQIRNIKLGPWSLPLRVVTCDTSLLTVATGGLVPITSDLGSRTEIAALPKDLAVVDAAGATVAVVDSSHLSLPYYPSCWRWL